MRYNYLLILLAIFWQPSVAPEAIEWPIDQTTKDCTALAKDEKTLVVFSTLRGGLTAVDAMTSEIKWSIEDEPAIKAEAEPHSPLPQFLPDPRDGSLYQLSTMGNLKKLPYTVPQLVASAPCRSSDGILYSGKKSDSWYLIDPKTGHREKVMGFMKNDRTDEVEYLENNGKIGWATSCSIFLGRTQYTVMMLDSSSENKNLKPWNITYYDYTSNIMAPESSSDYGYIHLTGSSSGIVVTLNKQGSLLWKKDLGSPIVSVFLLKEEGLLNVPFTTVADNVLENIIRDSMDETINEVKLFQSIYIGENANGFYALPSLVDEDTARLTSIPHIKLLEGPDSKKDAVRPNNIYIPDFLLLGHYNLHSKGTVDLSIHNKGRSSHNFKEIEAPKEVVIRNIKSNCFETNENSRISQPNNIKKLLYEAKSWLPDNHSDHVYQYLLILILPIITFFWYWSTSREILKSLKAKQSHNGSPHTYKELIDLGEGHVQVGKIIFNSKEILGKGCEGTFVFRGTFEKRNVAVKRLLPECFTFADREVALLRESDAHQNVVRYFCTEQDRQFRYIALELCIATLQDFTEGSRCDELYTKIDVWEILKQATSGLSHLHSLSIVHRDIKPQNVLLSLPDSNNAVRAMISDFGLCKKLNGGKNSFSQRSGITGTEGWIAPEMISGKRTTTSVDIFSLGCVFFYVLTKGHHAFGDTLRRQANILTNEYDLSKLQHKKTDNLLKSKLIMAEQLIIDMIQHEYEKRPDARAVCDHPLFWNEKKILAFLQDVSDRVEKLTFDVEPLRSLEKNGCVIIYKDWSLCLETEITNDLRKYRGYTGTSVRDLLRALRNKRHHYRELSVDAQLLLGSIPNEFTRYWIFKFPYLLQHAYHALSYCSNENLFRCYYNQKYLFSKPSYFSLPNEDDSSLLMNDQNILYSKLINPARSLNRPYKKPYTKKYKNIQKYMKDKTNNTNNEQENNIKQDSIKTKVKILCDRNESEGRFNLHRA